MAKDKVMGNVGADEGGRTYMGTEVGRWQKRKWTDVVTDAD